LLSKVTESFSVAIGLHPGLQGATDLGWIQGLVVVLDSDMDVRCWHAVGWRLGCLPCGVHYGLDERRMEWGFRVRELDRAKFCSARKKGEPLIKIG